jgi:hypothetical protein
MAFYKRKYTANCSYDSIQEDVDHAPFHDCIRDKNNGKIFMNPALLLRYKVYDAELLKALRK